MDRAAARAVIVNKRVLKMSERIRQFDAAIKKWIVPPLAERGFIADSRRRVFRRAADDSEYHFVQIIELQVGRKFTTGHFTVNLGAFCREVNHREPERANTQPEVVECLWDMTKRLGRLFDPPRGFLARALRLKPKPPFDYWWTLEEDPDRMTRNVVEVRDCLLKRGIPWLTEMVTRDKLLWAKEQLEERKRALNASTNESVRID
jgi:hypothetical protein